MTVQWKKSLIGLGAIAAAAAAYVTSGRPPGLYAITFAAVACGLIVVSASVFPESLLILAILYSTVTGGPSTTPLASWFPFDIHGALTGSFLVASGIVLWLHRHDLKWGWVRSLGPFLLFLMWEWVRLVGSPAVKFGLSDAIIISVPILLAVVARLVVSTNRLTASGLERFLLFSTGLPVGILGMSAMLGYTQWTSLGLINPVEGTRSLALYLLVAVSLCLAWTRTKVTTRTKWLTAVWSFILLMLMYVTLSRTPMAIAVGFLLPVALIRPTKILSWVGAAILGAALVAVVMILPGFQERLTWPPTSLFSLLGQGASSSAPVVSNSAPGVSTPVGLNTSGRINSLWPATFKDALRNPWLGLGSGSARALTTSLYGIDHPHNDFLRVFHDLGVIGLILLLVAWVSRIHYHWRNWLGHPELTGPRAHLHMAAFLCAVAVTLSFTTDNTLVYVFVLIPTFILFALADAQTESA